MKAYPAELKAEAIRLRVEDRLSVKDVAEAINISSDTASRWLKGFVLTPEELHDRMREAALKIIRIRNPAKVYITPCFLCGKEFSHVSRKRKYCSNRCKAKANYHIRKGRSQSVVSWRQRMKVKAIAYKGGKCLVCGYDKCVGALDFHHVDPSKKDFSIGSSGKTRAWVKMKIELDKCVLLCSNCHREHHHGVLDLNSFIEACPESGIGTGC